MPSAIDGMKEEIKAMELPECTRGTRGHVDELNGTRDCSEGLSKCMDAPRIKNGTKTPVKPSKNIRTHQLETWGMQTEHLSLD